MSEPKKPIEQQILEAVNNLAGSNVVTSQEIMHLIEVNSKSLAEILKKLGQVKPQEAVTPKTSEKKPQSLKAILDKVPERFQKILEVEHVGGKVHILQTQYLPNRDDWIELNNFFKSYGFEWVKNGKRGYWEVQKA